MQFKKIMPALGTLINSYINGFRNYLYNYCFTYFPSHHLRLFYLRYVMGVRIGKGSFVHMGCFFEGNKIQIGQNSVIGRNCYLGGSVGKLTIKDNVSITAQTYIFCSSHAKDSPHFESTYSDVTIEDRAWIGARAMILPGVHIGKGAVLGAQSTATKNIPDFSVFAGSPAKNIGTRNRNLSYTLRYHPIFQ